MVKVLEILQNAKKSIYLTRDASPNAIRENRTRLIKADYFRRLITKSYNGGSIVECGVGAGSGLAILLSMRLDFKLSSAKIYAFDSYKGFPDGSENDRSTGPIKPRYKKYDINFVKSGLLGCGFSSYDIDQSISFIEGWFPESFSEYDGGAISFLHLDVDLYQSYLDSLKFFYDIVLPGGIIAFDEYKDPDDMKKWPGASLAIDEFLGKKISFIQRDELSGKYYYVKPK